MVVVEMVDSFVLSAENGIIPPLTPPAEVVENIFRRGKDFSIDWTVKYGLVGEKISRLITRSTDFHDDIP